jgi:hypothetical protein
MSTPYYLAVWSADREVSNEDAAKQYAGFARETGAGEFNESVHGFFSEFVESMYQFYAELMPDDHETYTTTEKNLESIPLVGELEIADDHLIIGLAQERHGAVLPLIWNLAEVYGLVCYDLQTAKVHEPRM